MPQNLTLVEKVKQIAARHNATPGQLALAWVHAQGEDVFPIPGTKRIKYLQENIEAFNIKLSPAELKELNDVFPHGAVRFHDPCCYCIHTAHSNASGYRETFDIVVGWGLRLREPSFV